MLAPNVLIMRAMGWTSFTHLAAAASWAVFSTAIIILTSKRHRRQGWRTRTALAILAGWVVLGAGAVGMNWNARAVIVALLVLPGLNYLLLEALGLTPKADASSAALQ
ncbi:MAG: hypothetical protein ABIP65_08910 [Vicinamibacterales bacterium]